MTRALSPAAAERSIREIYDDLYATGAMPGEIDFAVPLVTEFARTDFGPPYREDASDVRYYRSAVS